MRILVVGAGAVGGYLGALLADAGREVTFLVRPDRAKHLAGDGLVVHRPHGDLVLKPQLVETGAIAGTYDVILLSVKGPALDRAMTDFAPAVGPDAMILPVLNGMRHIDLLRARFGDGPVLGGVCLVATELDGDGSIRRLADLQSLRYGEIDGARSDRVAALDRAMQGAGLDAAIADDIVQAMWDKWVQLASQGAITTLIGGAIGAVVAAGGTATALAIIDECRAIVTALGHPTTDAVIDRLRENATRAGSPFTTSLYRDMRAGRPIENQAIIDDLLHRGMDAGVRAPLLAAAAARLHLVEQVRAAAAGP